MSKLAIASFVQSVIDQKPADSQKLFRNIMSEKILHKLAEKRHSMAKTLFRNLGEAVEQPSFSIVKDNKVLCKYTDEAKAKEHCAKDKTCKMYASDKLPSTVKKD